MLYLSSRKSMAQGKRSKYCTPGTCKNWLTPGQPVAPLERIKIMKKEEKCLFENENTAR